MYDALKEAKDSSTIEKGVPWAVAIAMNPQNGQILGMVSLPSYDNNIFAKEIGEDYLKLEKDERRPLINYAIGGLYPPGLDLQDDHGGGGAVRRRHRSRHDGDGRRANLPAQPLLPQ